MTLPWHKIVDYVDGTTIKEWDGISEQFLQITQDTVLSIPCPKKPAYCNMVIRHKGEDNYRGVCEKGAAEGCDSVSIPRKSLTLYNFKKHDFMDSLCTHLNIDEKQCDKFEDFSQLWKMGTYKPHNQHQFPVFFLMDRCAHNILNALNHIKLGTGSEHFMLVVPLKDSITLKIEQYCYQNKIRIYALENIFVPDPEMFIKPLDYINGDIRRWMNNFIYRGNKIKTDYFPEIDNIKWEDITIRFIDRQEVLIYTKPNKFHGRYTNFDMGMFSLLHKSDTDTPHEDKQWDTLRRFAKNNGYLETNGNTELKRPLKNAYTIMTFGVRTVVFIVRFVQRIEDNRENFGYKRAFLTVARSRQYAVKPFVSLGFWA